LNLLLRKLPEEMRQCIFYIYPVPKLCCEIGKTFGYRGAPPINASVGIRKFRANSDCTEGCFRANHGDTVPESKYRNRRRNPALHMQQAIAQTASLAQMLINYEIGY